MEEIVKIFPRHLHTFCTNCFNQTERPEEIRVRILKPLTVYIGCQELFWNQERNQFMYTQENSYIVKKKDIDEILLLMSQYSMYAFEEEIKKGFFTIQGGHRVGLAGKTICENKSVKTIRHISFLNIRIAGEKKGCANPLIPHIRKGESIYNTLIISPPGVGKTTILRDCIRILSQGEKKGHNQYAGKKVGVVDERSEIAACYLGMPQNDLGPRTDVMDCCPKAEGMLMLLRSMSPEVICVDELSGQVDFQAVEQVLHSGCHIVGTMHGESILELKEKPYLKKWLEKGYFERYIILIKTGSNRKLIVYNEKLEEI